MTLPALSHDLNPAQHEVVERGLLSSGFSAVLQMPTGSGKTWLAEQAIATVLERGRRAVYLTPLRALANELVERWSARFSDHSVGVFTGEYGQKQDYPVPFDKARLLIMTPERLDACTRHWRTHWSWLPEVDLLVVDELHLLGERGRGPRLEGALMRVRRLNPFLQFLGLSATLGNRPEIADWLGGVHHASTWKPIPITWRYVRFKRATDKPAMLQAEVARCIAAGGQSLVFVQSRRRAETLAATLREAGISSGHHHAGLDGDERRSLEHSYRTGALRALVSTGTLEMGLNLPARQVVLYDLQAFDGNDFVPLSVNSVWQRAGRAGRRGLDKEGEVVLLTAAWEKSAERYSAGKFESIRSGLSEARALSEQVLAEVSSGLARTRSQLHRNIEQSLAAHQRSLPNLDRVLADMLEGGMLCEVTAEGAHGAALKATRLGRIAVRQMLAPTTVAYLAKALEGVDSGLVSLFDLLLLGSLTDDCQPLIPVDFEELDTLSAQLAQEHSSLLSGTHSEVVSRLPGKGRRLLAVIKTALVAQHWTRHGNAETTADEFGCYAFEVRRLTESLERVLTAAVAIATPPREDSSNPDKTEPPAHDVPDTTPSLVQRLRALLAMVTHGVDEQVVTLTFVPGIGGTLARRLRDGGITDIEELALAEPTEVAGIRGVSAKRAERWISFASELVRTHSAHALRDDGPRATAVARAWNSPVDPYRLRRALELRVLRRSTSHEVSGGLEPHQVVGTADSLACDCADFGKGNVCKHILAVRLYAQDVELTSIVRALEKTTDTQQLDLFHLWFEGGPR